MQTQIIVAAISATPISSHQDNTSRPSQVPDISVLQITRCLDSSSDKIPAEKDLAGARTFSASLHILRSGGLEYEL